MISFKKIAKFRVHGFISAIILISIFLFSAYQVNIKAAGSKVFAGRISAQIQMSTCTDPYTCEACSLCGCGDWDEDIIAPLFGMNTNSTFYACAMPSYMPGGTGSLRVGSIVLGYCPSTQLSMYNPTCNIWTQ